MSDYDASSIRVLSGLEHVRVRPAMYIGSTNVSGLNHLLYEIIDNSVDEYGQGYGTKIYVSLNDDGSCTVKDFGRGIPVDADLEQGIPAVRLVLTTLNAGGKFNNDSYLYSSGLHGVGSSVVNALSEWMDVEVYRDGNVYHDRYEYGKPVIELEDGMLTVIGTSKETGTKITFKPDASIFSETVYDYETLANRLRDLAFLNAGITLTLTDLRVLDEEGNPKREVFHSKDGLREFVQYLDEGKEPLIEDIIDLKTERNGVPVEVAMTYNNDFNENIYSYVNNINTIEGGTHLTGFRRGLTTTLKKYADDNHLLDKLKIELSKEDFRDGLTAVVSVKVAEPQFEGQTKTKLGNNEVMGVVQTAVSEALRNYLEEHPKQAKTIVDKVVLAAQARHAAYNAKMRVQNKSSLGGAGLPGKLAPCKSRIPEDCELFLVEGDSAGGSAKQGRNPHYQAILPLRGKILNVEKAMDHKILESQEIVNMYKALGVTIGTEEDSKAPNMTKLRYHKIIIMTDADVDGAHIATLLMTFFYRRMRPIIDNGYLYIATPPLYRCDVKGKKKGEATEYCWTDQQVQRYIDTKCNGDRNRLMLQRYKGLGEMNPEQLWETTMDPENRMLKQVNLTNAAEADRTFAMLMGEEVAPRRDFIEAHATYANIDA